MENHEDVNETDNSTSMIRGAHAVVGQRNHNKKKKKKKKDTAARYQTGQTEWTEPTEMQPRIKMQKYRAVVIPFSDPRDAPDVRTHAPLHPAPQCEASI